MEIIFDDENNNDYETEIIDGILTIDELLQDDYYKAEIEKYVQQRVEDKNSQSGVKGVNTMEQENQTTTPTGEQAQGTAAAQTATPPIPNATADNPTATTETAETETDTIGEEHRGMTAEQFKLYNETLRSIAAVSGSNAFENAEIKTLVKQQVISGATPDPKVIAASLTANRQDQSTATAEPNTEQTTQTPKDGAVGELKAIKAELALMKAGIAPERLDAAKTLFLAEGGDLSQVSDFVAKYPEWKSGANNGVTFTQAAPVDGRTAPTPNGQPVMNDFERKVHELRKARGLE